MVSRSFSVRTVDARYLRFETANDLPDERTDRWGGHARFVPRYGRRGTTADLWALEVGPLSAFGAAIESMGGRESQRFAFAGGEIVIVDCARPKDARWAAWLGPWHLAHGMFYAPAWETADIVETFGRVRWVDTPEGLTADPGPRFALQKAVYLVALTGIGTLKLQARHTADGLVPQWRGFTAGGGEIWRMPGSPVGGPEPLLFATTTAVATLFPWDAPPPGPHRDTPPSGRGSVEAGLDFLRTMVRLDWGS